MSVRPQAMHLSFVVLSWSTRVGRERHQDATASRPTLYFYLLGKSGFGCIWVHLEAALGRHVEHCGARGFGLHTPALLHAHAHSLFLMLG